MSQRHTIQQMDVVFEDDSNWLFVLVVLPLGLQLVQLWRLIRGFERPPMAPDAAIFQHIGWVVARGGRLYVDAWEPKLPLPFQTTAALAVLAGGDMSLFHLLNIALMVFAAVGSMVLVGLLTHHITGDEGASLLAGLSLLLLPGYLIRPAYGFKAKYLLLFCGLLSIYLLLNDHPVASGAAAAASVGYYQLGVIFPLVVVGLAWQRSGVRTAGKVVASGIALTVLSFAPVLFVWHSASEFVAQAFVIPLAVGGGAGLLEKVLAGGVHFKWASPFVLVGGYGFISSVRDDLGTDHWWVTVCTLWFALALFLIDFDVGGYTDLIPGLAFMAIGIGLFAHRYSERDSRVVLVSGMVAVIILNTVAFGSVGLVFEPVDTREPQTMESLSTNERAQELQAVPNDTPDVRYLYWNKETAATCHYRLSLTEVHWLNRAGSHLSSDCSDMAEVNRVLGG